MRACPPTIGRLAGHGIESTTTDEARRRRRRTKPVEDDDDERCAVAS